MCGLIKNINRSYFKSGLKMQISKGNELFMGVMIGLYGNWLIQLLDKIQNKDWIPLLAFTFSFFPFVLFFKEVFSEEQRRLKHVSLKLVLGGVYILMVYGAIALSGLSSSDYFFSITGVFLWIVLLQASSRS